MEKMMTPETKKILLESSIIALERYRENINQLIRLPQKNGIPIDLIQFSLYFYMVGSDFSVLQKQYCLADQRWEEIVIVQQIYVKINESLKKIIGFDENGSNNSYWIKTMGTYVENNTIFESQYIELKQKLIEYAQNEEVQKIIKFNRDIAVHGDCKLDALNQFKILNSLNADSTFKFLIEWNLFLQEITQFLAQCYEEELRIRQYKGMNNHRASK